MTHPLEPICKAIVAGDMSGIPQVEFPEYSEAAYRKAAQIALDCEDFSEMQFMFDADVEADREERAERFREMLAEGRRPATLSSGWLVGGAA